MNTTQCREKPRTIGRAVTYSVVTVDGLPVLPRAALAACAEYYRRFVGVTVVRDDGRPMTPTEWRQCLRVAGHD
jgi:hypothetical protein